MKSPKTRSLFYSVIVHVVLLVFVLSLGWLVREKVQKVSSSRTTVVTLSQVVSSCELPVLKKVPEKTVKLPAKKVCKPKKVKPKPVRKKVLKPKKKPVVKKKALLKQAPKVEEKVVESKPLPPKRVEQTAEAEEKLPEDNSELVVTPHAPAMLSQGAKQKIAKPATPESTPQELYVKAHISEIMALLRKHLYYPRMARKRHMQGKVLVRFELLTDGSIRNITILESKRELLGKAAVTTIERLDGKFPLPDETLVLNVPIMYQLK